MAHSTVRDHHHSRLHVLATIAIHRKDSMTASRHRAIRLVRLHTCSETRHLQARLVAQLPCSKPGTGHRHQLPPRAPHRSDLTSTLAASPLPHLIVSCARNRATTTSTDTQTHSETQRGTAVPAAHRPSAAITRHRPKPLHQPVSTTHASGTRREPGHGEGTPAGAPTRRALGCLEHRRHTVVGSRGRAGGTARLLHYVRLEQAGKPQGGDEGPPPHIATILVANAYCYAV